MIRLPVTPAPDKGIARVFWVVFTFSVTVPLYWVDCVGAKSTRKVVDWPAAMVLGTLNPVTVKVLPEELKLETVALLPPTFVNVIDWVLLVPTGTFEKLAVVGVAENDPGLPDEEAEPTPVPAKGSVTDPLEALLVKTSDALDAPATVGANFTITTILWPGVIVTGSVNPIRLKPEPLTYPCENTTFALPVLSMEKLWELLLPRLTLPNCRPEELNQRYP